MRKPQKQVSEDDMFAILKKHTAPKVGESPKAKVVPKLEHEMWLAKRLGTYGDEVFTGDTTPEIRCVRMRQAIKAARLEDVSVGRKPDGTTETHRDVFARLYGEPL